MFHEHSSGSNTLHSKEINTTDWGSETETVERVIKVAHIQPAGS